MQRMRKWDKWAKEEKKIHANFWDIRMSWTNCEAMKRDARIYQSVEIERMKFYEFHGKGKET